MTSLDIFLFYILPIFGCFLVLWLSLSPVKQLLECEKNNSLGTFNPLPPCLFFLTNLVWLLNALLIKDVIVFVINSLLFTINFQITIRAYRLASDKQKREMEMILHIFFWFTMILGYVYLGTQDLESTKVAYGWLCCFFNMTIFVPPLFLLNEIIRTKDSSTISAPFAIAGSISCGFWAFYGLLIQQYPMLIPNGFGCVLSIIQAAFTILYPPGNLSNTQTAKTLLNSSDTLSDSSYVEITVTTNPINGHSDDQQIV